MAIHELALYGLAVLLVLIVMVFFVLRDTVSKGEVRRSTEELRNYLAEVQERLSLIQPHIMDYFNTLHANGDDSLEVLNAIIFAIETKLRKVDELLKTDTKSSVREAGEILSSDIDFREGNVSGVIPKFEGMRILPPNSWEPTIEQLFQNIGLKVAKASSDVAAYRQMQRRRKSTISSLIAAGIKGVTGHTRRITGTFKSLVGQTEKKSQ